VCVVIPNEGEVPGNELASVLANAVASGMGTSFRPARIIFSSDLPRTRNMKTLRRVVRSVLLDEPLGDLSTLANPEALEELKLAAARDHL
jgi:acetyl-CoA synthetase